MADTNEQEKLRGLVRDLAPNWGDEIAQAVSLMQVFSLRALVAKLETAKTGGGMAVTY